LAFSEEKPNTMPLIYCYFLRESLYFSPNNCQFCVTLSIFHHL
jgi:hypothetical protein